jgi:hypothetical protein
MMLVSSVDLIFLTYQNNSLVLFHTIVSRPSRPLAQVARALPWLNKFRPSYVIIGLLNTDKKEKLNKERIHPKRLK